MATLNAGRAASLANSAPNPGLGRLAPRMDLFKPSISGRKLASVLALSAA